MRKLAAILASLTILGTQTARAELLGLGQMTYDGSLEVLGNQASNETDANGDAPDRRGNTITRLRLGLNLPSLADGLSGRVEFVRNSDTGTGTTQYGAPSPTAPGGSGVRSTVQDEMDTIAIQNAYINLHDLFNLDKVRLGRQYGGRRGDLLVYYGPNRDDALSVNAFDSLLIEEKWKKVNLLFVTGKVAEVGGVPGSGTETTEGDVNATYFTVSSDELFSDYRIPLEAGYYTATNAQGAGTADNQNLVIYDFRGGYSFLDDALNASLEYAMNAGQDNNGGTPMSYNGSALLVKADYQNPDNGFGVSGFYANASGDDQNTANNDDDAFHDGSVLGGNTSDFRYGEILTNSNTFGAAFGGGAGLDTGANGQGLNVIGLGGSFTPANWMDGKVTFKLDYVTAKFNEIATGANDGIGNEIDVAAKYRHSDVVSVALGYARLAPKEGLVGLNQPDDEITKLWAKLKVRWGGEREDDMDNMYKSSRPAASKPVIRKR